MYRDTDFHYDSNTHRVRFPHIYYTNYISSHVEKLYEADSSAPPRFSQYDKQVGTVDIESEDKEKAFGFMSALTKEHDLTFSRKVTHLATKVPRTKLLSATTRRNKGHAKVQIWRSRKQKTANNSALQFIARYDDHEIEDRWLGLTLHPTAFEKDSDGTRVSFPKAPYQRGRRIDMAALSATDPRESGKREEAREKVGPRNMIFVHVRDRAGFVDLVGCLNSGSGMQRSPLDELMTSRFVP